MKYYEEHDARYRALEAQGQTCWDERPYDDFFMRPFLESALARLGSGGTSTRALEIGCGTGPVSVFLAARGYDVLGVDVSPTAIHMATQFARERSVPARFEVQDVVEMQGKDEYDLIVDGHCLHCIVYDEERARLLSAVRRLLRDGGAFLVETMAAHPGMNLPIDERGILWRGSSPSRRILSPPDLVEELARAGFAIEWWQAAEEESAGEPKNFQAILRG